LAKFPKPPSEKWQPKFLPRLSFKSFKTKMTVFLIWRLLVIFQITVILVSVILVKQRSFSPQKRKPSLLCLWAPPTLRYKPTKRYAYANSTKSYLATLGSVKNLNFGNQGSVDFGTDDTKIHFPKTSQFRRFCLKPAFDPGLILHHCLNHGFPTPLFIHFINTISRWADDLSTERK